MKLLGSPTSPYARKARIALIEKNVDCEFVPDRPANPGTQVPKYNPLSKVPVLVLDNDKGMIDSSVIAEYFDGIGGGAKLIPQEFNARIAVRQWEALGDGITDAIVALTHDSRYTPTCEVSADWYQKQLKKIENGLAAAQRDIGANEFCYGNAFSLGDICIGMALGYLDRAYAQYDWRAKYPDLKRYADKLFARPSFAQTAAN
ncbi:MAG: glutathione S-transferase [Betaproteobacteria bacterium]|nr:glutathione S-transferase [Betaproteobacteria bacterium]